MATGLLGLGHRSRAHRPQRDRFRVEGADGWRHPSRIPADFEDRRTHYCAAPSRWTPSEFIGRMRQEMISELLALQDTLPHLG